jgi:hypothetical protein
MVIFSMALVSASPRFPLTLILSIGRAPPNDGDGVILSGVHSKTAARPRAQMEGASVMLVERLYLATILVCFIVLAVVVQLVAH